MVIFSAGDYHKKVLPASQLHIERETSAHYTQEELISNGFCTTTNVLLNVVFHLDFSKLICKFILTLTSFYCHGCQSHNGDWMMNDDSVLPDRGLTW